MGPIAGIAGFEGGKDAPPGRAIIEIGPYDLPPPEGGYVDLVLDEEPSAPAAGAVGGAPTRVPSRSIPVPEAPPPGPGDGGAPRTLPREAGPAPARARAPRILVPETLLVGGFLLLGATFAAAVHLARTSSPPVAPVAVAAPIELAQPKPSPARRRVAARTTAIEGRAVPAGPSIPGDAVPDAGGAGASARSAAPADPPPTSAEAPVDPQAPPDPSLAPWGGGG